jgi:hypothetical protein
MPPSDDGRSHVSVSLRRERASLRLSLADGHRRGWDLRHIQQHTPLLQLASPTRMNAAASNAPLHQVHLRMTPA